MTAVRNGDWPRAFAVAACSLVITAVMTGALAALAAPFTDWRGQRPGAVHEIHLTDLPQPNSSRSVDNGPSLVARPRDAWPKVPPGFQVGLYADHLMNPRLLRTAPNGDVFVVESRPGQVRLSRGLGPDGRARDSAGSPRG